MKWNANALGKQVRKYAIPAAYSLKFVKNELARWLQSSHTDSYHVFYKPHELLVPTLNLPMLCKYTLRKRGTLRVTNLKMFFIH